MSTRTLLLSVLLTLAAAGVAPAASALGEDCVVRVTFWTYSASCSGTFNGGASFVSCPNEPWIDCLDSHILTCYVGTSTPWACWIA